MTNPAAPTKVRYAVLAVLCSLAFLTYLDRICISRAQANIKKDLGFDRLSAEQEETIRRLPADEQEFARKELQKKTATERMGWILSAFLWGYVLFEVPGGWLGDTYGPRRIIFRIVVWWSVFTALTGSAEWIARLVVQEPTAATFVICLVLIRFLFGAGEAGAYPNVSRVVARWFPADHRARIQGVVWLASRWGGAAAPIVFGALSRATGDWRMVFWILGILGAAWAAAFWWWFRDRPEEMAGVNKEECDLIRSSQASAGSVYDDASHAPLPWNRLFGSANLWALYLAAATSSFVWYAFYAGHVSTYLAEHHKVDADSPLSELMTFLPLFGAGICSIAGGWFSDFLVARLGSRRWGRSIPGVIAFTLAGAFLALVPLQTNPWAAALCIAAACTFADLHMAPLWSLTGDIGGRYAGTLSGTLNMICNTGGAIGVLGFTWVFVRNPSAAIWLCSGVYFIGAVLWLRVDANERLMEPVEPTRT